MLTIWVAGRPNWVLLPFAGWLSVSWPRKSIPCSFISFWFLALETMPRAFLNISLPQLEEPQKIILEMRKVRSRDSEQPAKNWVHSVTGQGRNSSPEVLPLHCSTSFPHITRHLRKRTVSYTPSPRKSVRSSPWRQSFINHFPWVYSHALVWLCVSGCFQQRLTGHLWGKADVALWFQIQLRNQTSQRETFLLRAQKQGFIFPLCPGERRLHEYNALCWG